MLEAIVSAGPGVEIKHSPKPKPSPDQVLIRVAVAAANPVDWKLPEWMATKINQGNDGAGVVEQVGKDVTGFQPGDRVAGFHAITEPGGTYAEYALLPAHTSFLVPKDMSFEEAATVSLTAGTAAVALFATTGGLALPFPTEPATEPLPLVIYGASGSVGSYAVQLAKKANIHPLICVAGAGAAQVQRYLDRSQGDIVIDYRKGQDATEKSIKEALQGKKLRHGLDTVANRLSSVPVANAMESGGKIARVLDPSDEVRKDVEQYQLSVSVVHGDQKDFGAKVYQLIGQGLKEGWIEPRPYEVIRGGLNGVEQGLKNLKAGKASAIKYVFRIDETDGLDGES